VKSIKIHASVLRGSKKRVPFAVAGMFCINGGHRGGDVLESVAKICAGLKLALWKSNSR